MGTALLSWTLRRALRSPLAWVIWAGSMGLLPVLELISPIGLTTRGGRPGAWLAEILTATALVGAAFALEGLSSARGLLDRYRASERACAGWTVTWSTLIFILPSLVSSYIFLSLANWSTALPDLTGVALTLAHVVALAWLLALLPIPDGGRSIALVFLAWLLAGWVPTTSLATSALSTLTDVSHASRIDLWAATWGARMAALAPIMVLVGACLGIRPARTHSP